MLSTISSVLQALASALSYDMFVSVANRSSKRGDLFNRIGVLVIGVWGLFLTFLAPQGLLNQIAYIGTGGLISSFVGPIIMRAFVKADIYTCLASMAIGFLCNVLFVFKLQMGWVEAPILAGLAGTVVYLIMGYIINGGARVPKELDANDNVGIQQ
jgi:sodium/proline symporter